ncbi:hypothetical protein [Listeria sp. PSOL-1]|uniref:hypothetical protein n=1 Tax=Listeria sp. PSOL-1 TaxID=1844999 RepID=UPI0013D257DD|nr:hypothetical protein [Listeria sp. PSOL-1]
MKWNWFFCSILLGLTLIGLLTGGVKSFLILLLTGLIVACLGLFFLSRFKNTEDKKYQKAVKQNKSRQKRKKSRLKVIDGGKK